MLDLIKMVVVLTVLSLVSGGLLAFVENNTKAQKEEQQLKYDKAPAIHKLFANATNDPVTDRIKVADGDKEVMVFVAEVNGKKNQIGIEAAGKGGFGGDVGLIVGIDTDKDKLTGLGVTISKETPGVGSRAKTDPSFGAQFDGMPLAGEYKVRADGGTVDAISGATVTSRAVCRGVGDAVSTYDRLKDKIMDKING